MAKAPKLLDEWKSHTGIWEFSELVREQDVPLQKEYLDTVNKHLKKKRYFAFTPLSIEDGIMLINPYYSDGSNIFLENKLRVSLHELAAVE